MMSINKYILELTVLVCGAVVMIFELVGSRVLGPYFGTSIFVWTSLIGIILGSLSLGYFLGGKLADRNPRFHALALIIFFAGLSIGGTVFFHDALLIYLQTKLTNIRLASVLAALLLFSPASILLGMVSPYAAKLRVENIATLGSAVGNLYALSTAGSILGTFLAGFYLIPHFGTNTLLVILSLILLFLPIILPAEKSLKRKLAFASALLISLLFMSESGAEERLRKNMLIDVDTSYNRIWIYTHSDPKTRTPVKTMGINSENHSSMFLESDVLAVEYTKYYHLADYFHPNFKKALMLGGGGYSYPKDFLLRYGKATLDVVEIDPAVTELAKKHFRLKENPRLGIYHEDGRAYLNKTEKKYDAIFVDAFSSYYSIPYQLTTKEAIEKEYALLNTDGIVIVNIISAIEGEKGEFLRAEYATYKSVFPQVYLFPVDDPSKGNGVQNIILVALKSEVAPKFLHTNREIDEYLQHLWIKEVDGDMPILTDDFAPVDYYMSKAI